MKIFIVDKKYCEPDYMIHWKEHLEHRGHKVDTGLTMNDILDISKDLSSYHVGVAHPNIGEESKLIRDEVAKRPDFKLIMYHTGVERIVDETIELLFHKTKQVFYSEILDNESLTLLVENDWDKIMAHSNILTLHRIYPAKKE